MRDEGKQALHIWVTPEQATKVQAAIHLVEPAPTKPLRVTKPTGQLVPVVEPLPSIPSKAPASIVRDLQEAQALRKKKLAQIEKLKKDASGIESWYRQTVAAFKNIG